MRLCSKCQIDSEDFVNFCDLLRKHELYQKRCQKDFDSIEGHCHRKGSKHHKPKGSSQYPAPLTYFYWKEPRVRQAHKWSEIFSKFSGFLVWSSKFNCLTWKSERKLWIKHCKSSTKTFWWLLERQLDLILKLDFLTTTIQNFKKNMRSIEI